MAHLQYYSYKGVGERNLKSYGYSQAVRVGDQIECSGQGIIYPLLYSHQPFFYLSQIDCLQLTWFVVGGWDPETGAYESSLDAQIKQAFANVELCLKDAGGKGWSQVFRVVSYHPSLKTEAVEIMIREFKTWMPDHNPIWTCIGVESLAESEMMVEIQVSAHDPK